MFSSSEAYTAFCPRSETTVLLTLHTSNDTSSADSCLELQYQEKVFGQLSAKIPQPGVDIFVA